MPPMPFQLVNESTIESIVGRATKKRMTKVGIADHEGQGEPVAARQRAVAPPAAAG